MYIIKRKNMVKMLSIIFGLLLIIVGFVLYNSHIKKQYENKSQMQNLTIITNICASVENISNSFEKAYSLNNYQNENSIIFSNSNVVQSLLYLSNEPTENTVKWFKNLCEYSKTPMDDIEKNNYYTEKIKGFKTLLINICSKFNSKTCYKQLEDYFTEQQNTEYYNQILKQMESNYSLLENRITAERKDVTGFAKEVLRLTFSPTQFKGSHLFPKAICYSLNNSYANIFPSGKTLLSMSSSDTLNGNKNNTNNDTQAKVFLDTYAPYASKCQQVFKITNQNTVYYIFCPVFEKNNINIINYDESIKIALNAKKNTLRAFDATKYLKNHPVLAPEYIPDFTDISFEDNIEILSNNYILHKGDYYIQYKIKTKDSVTYYTVTDSKNNTRYYSEANYLKYLNIT